ncbi:MAG: GNAT family N-acetyltransferase, partial [Clostridiales bacterium]|nr:GNAT family N-acetyltransferase [Clostridiales bacterium]
LDTYLVAHLNSSPMFMPRKPRNTSKSIEKEIHDKESRYFVAKDSEKIIGYIKISDSGETFACEAKDMANICGAYLLPEYRGRGIYTALLSYLMDVLIEEGIARCGVDFESLNPTASGFWLKHFIPYTYSVTRRIDERVYKP